MALLLNDLIYDDMTSPLPLLICTWFLKNQVWKIKLKVIYSYKSRFSSLKLWKFSLFYTCCSRQKFLIQTIQSETVKKLKKWPYFFLMFFGFKTFPFLSLDFCKSRISLVFLAFEEHMLYQKFQLLPTI